MKTFNPFARIVVGYDDSPQASVALDQALKLAAQFGGEVVVVNVSADSVAMALPLQSASIAPGIDATPVLRSLDRYRSDLYRRVQARVVDEPVHVSIEFSANNVAAGILDAAVRWNASAIVLGTHARTGASHALVGSVAEDVVRNTALPTVVVRERTIATPFRRIVVGIDYVEHSPDPSAFSLELARDRAVDVMYCCVIDTKTIGMPAGDLVFDPTDLIASTRASAEGMLAAAVAAANAVDVFPQREVADSNDIAAGILDVARRFGAHAIVVATHHRGGIERLIVGSTAESLMRHSQVPVVVVPPNRAIRSSLASHRTADVPKPATAQ